MSFKYSEDKDVIKKKDINKYHKPENTNFNHWVIPPQIRSVIWSRVDLTPKLIPVVR